MPSYRDLMEQASKIIEVDIVEQPVVAISEAADLYKTAMVDGEWAVVDKNGEFVEAATSRLEAIQIARDLNANAAAQQTRKVAGSQYGSDKEEMEEGLFDGLKSIGSGIKSVAQAGAARAKEVAGNVASAYKVGAQGSKLNSSIKAIAQQIDTFTQGLKGLNDNEKQAVFQSNPPLFDAIMGAAEAFRTAGLVETADMIGEDTDNYDPEATGDMEQIITNIAIKHCGYDPEAEEPQEELTVTVDELMEALRDAYQMGSGEMEQEVPEEEPEEEPAEEIEEATTSASLQAGDKVMAGYKSWMTPNMFLGFSDDTKKYGESGPVFKNAKEMMAHYKVNNLRELQDLMDQNKYGFGVYMMFEDLEDGSEWNAYLYKGKWTVGTSADTLKLAPMVAEESVTESASYADRIAKVLLV